jgi:hypothetical protein
MERIWKILPDEGLTVIIYPPGNHPPHTPIVDSMYAVSYGTNPFATNRHGKHMPRWLGCEDAFIGSDLQVHVTVNPGDEVRMTWKASEESIGIELDGHREE